MQVTSAGVSVIGGVLFGTLCHYAHIPFDVSTVLLGVAFGSGWLARHVAQPKPTTPPASPVPTQADQSERRWQ